MTYHCDLPLRRLLRLLVSRRLGQGLADILPERQFKRIAVRIGEKRRIADRRPVLDRTAAQPARFARSGTQTVDFGAAFAGDPKMAERSERGIVRVRRLDQDDDEG